MVGINGRLAAVGVQGRFAVVGNGNLASGGNYKIGGNEQLNILMNAGCGFIASHGLIRRNNGFIERQLARGIADGNEFPEACAVIRPFI